jgi:aspartokinase
MRHNPDESFPVVVVSAMSGINDLLLNIARHICLGEYEESENKITTLRRKHFEAAEKNYSSLSWYVYSPTTSTH